MRRERDAARTAQQMNRTGAGHARQAQHEHADHIAGAELAHRSYDRRLTHCATPEAPIARPRSRSPPVPASRWPLRSAAQRTERHGGGNGQQFQRDEQQARHHKRRRADPERRRQTSLRLAAPPRTAWNSGRVLIAADVTSAARSAIAGRIQRRSGVLPVASTGGTILRHRRAKAEWLAGSTVARRAADGSATDRSPVRLEQRAIGA